MIIFAKTVEKSDKNPYNPKRMKKIRKTGAQYAKKKTFKYEIHNIKKDYFE